jgi:hypothetical protein
MKANLAVTETEWAERRRYWARKLGRIRLGVEPVEEQLAKYRRVNLVLTGLSFLVGVMFLALFSAFGRPAVGLILGAVLFVPVWVISWLDFALLSSRVKRYLRESKAFEKDQAEARTK